jgi:FKBP-type peptidyl-prolyl cis-trans isomerase
MVAEAYEVLRDPIMRARYDESLTAGTHAPRSGSSSARASESSKGSPTPPPPGPRSQHTNRTHRATAPAARKPRGTSIPWRIVTPLLAVVLAFFAIDKGLTNSDSVGAPTGQTNFAPSASATEPVPASPLDVIAVGGTNTAPTLSFSNTPFSVTVTTTKVITPGKGPKLSKDNSIQFNYLLLNGKDGKENESSFGKTTAGLDLSSASLLPGLSKGLTGQQIGSRLLVAIPPVDAFGAAGNAKTGFGPADTVVFFIDLLSASTPLKTATGTAVPRRLGSQLPRLMEPKRQRSRSPIPRRRRRWSCKR